MPALAAKAWLLSALCTCSETDRTAVASDEAGEVRRRRRIDYKEERRKTRKGKEKIREGSVKKWKIQNALEH